MIEIAEKNALHVTIARAPMVGASDYALAYTAQTLADIVADAIARKEVPERFWWHGRITVNGHLFAPQHWHLVRPHEGMHLHLWIPPGEPLSITSTFGLILFGAGAPLSVVNAVTFGGAALIGAAAGVVGNTGSQELFGGDQ